MPKKDCFHEIINIGACQIQNVLNAHIQECSHLNYSDMHRYRFAPIRFHYLTLLFIWMLHWLSQPYMKPPTNVQNIFQV